MAVEKISPLQLLVLALTAAESDMYELRRDAGVSPGAIAPAVDQLVNAGYLKKSRAGTHGKQEFSVTEAGTVLLGKQLREAHEGAWQRDLEAVLRIALCMVLTHDRCVIEFLDRAASWREGLAGQREKQIAAMEPKAPVRLYRWMRLKAQASQYRAEAELLHSMVEDRTILGV